MSERSDRLFEYQRHWLVKRSDTPNYHIYWCRPGTRRVRRKSAGTSDLEHAKRQLIEFANRRAQPRKSRHDEVLILDVLNDYVGPAISRSKLRWPAEKTALKHWLEFLDQNDVVTLDELTLNTQDDYIDWRRDRLLSQGFKASNFTLSREMRVMRTAVRDAWKRGVIEHPPYVKSVKEPPSRPRFLFRDEARRLLNACESIHLWRFCMVALHTLQRPGAIFQLRVEQVRLKEGRIDFLPEDQVQLRKRRPVVPISPTLRSVLVDAIEDSQSGHIIEFEGSPVTQVRRSFRNACKRAALEDVTPYTLRHTGATLLLASGVPIRQVAGMLGHTEQQTTERYGKHHPSFLREACDGVERLFGDKVGVSRLVTHHHPNSASLPLLSKPIAN